MRLCPILAALSEMIKHMSCQQLRDKLERFPDCEFGTYNPDHTVIIEVSETHDYLRCHLPRAIHIASLSDLRSFILNAATEVVVYPSAEKSVEAEILCRQLLEVGVANVYFYRDGKEDWLRNNLPTESTLVLADHLRNTA